MQNGVLSADLEPEPELWPALSKACHQHLEGKDSATMSGCDTEGNDSISSSGVCSVVSWARHIDDKGLDSL